MRALLKGFALLGLVILLSGANHPNPKRHSENTQTDDRVGDALTNIARLYDEQAKRPQSPDEKTEPCGPKKYGNNADLCAQWKAADAAADSAWWAWLGGLVGLGSLVGVFIAIGAAFQSNGIARDAAQRQLRAYLYPQRVAVVIRKVDERAKCQFEIALKNAGQTPAKLTFRYVQALCKSPQTKQVILGTTESDWRQLTRIVTNVEQSIGPDGTTAIPYSTHVKFAEFDHSGPRTGPMYEQHETIIKLVMEWRYEDFLDREWIERAVFISDSIEWNGEGAVEHVLAQVESTEMARLNGPKHPDSDSYHRLKHPPLSIGEKDRLKLRGQSRWWRRFLWV